MTVKWNWFMSASILAAGLLVKLGAPIESALAGVAIAACLSWKTRRASPSLRTADSRSSE